MNKEFVCICCPMGCHLSVQMDDNGQVTEVSGNTCKRGEEYAISEVTAPTRMVTSTVITLDGVSVPVKTANPIPKNMIFECMNEIKTAKLKLPVNTGDVVVKDVAGTGVDVIATRSFTEA